MKKKFLSIFKYVLFLSIGVVLFWLAVKDQDIHKIIDEIKKADFKWVGLSVISMILSHYYRSVRWKILTESSGYKVRLYNTVYAVFIGYFANLAVPRIGEISRCSVLSSTDKVPINALLGTVIVERVFDIICMLFIFIVVIITQIKTMSYFVENSILIPLINNFGKKTLIYLSLFSLFSLFALVYVFFRYLFPKTKGSKFYFKFLRIYSGFLTGLKSISKVNKPVKFIVYTILIWLFYTVTIYLLFFSFDDTSKLSFIDAITIMIIGALGVVVPTPGGIGAYQFIVSKGLIEIFNINSIVAISFSNVSYFSQWLLLIFAGIFSMLMVTIHDKKFINKQ